MTAPSPFTALAIQLYVLARRHEFDVCRRFGTVHNFVDAGLASAEAWRKRHPTANPAHITRTVLSLEEARITTSQPTKMSA